jgi:Antibiotic biosynthesis monooxygenase
MPKIIANSGVITQINVFDANPGREQELIALLQHAARACSEVEGWMSASLHLALDGKRVVNYAQCRDQDAWVRVMARLKEGEFLARNKLLGTAHPGLYQPVFTLERDG